MGSGAAGHVARRLANVVATLFQVGVTAAASATIQGVVDEGPRSLVEPALYAFTIWALIFVLSLAYAVYQALSANRDSRLLRRVGWFTAATFGRVRDGKRTVRAVEFRRYGPPEVLEALEVPRPCAPAPAAPRDVGSRDLRGAPYVNRSMS
jgi:hypothetical protein